jgi:hypothetical protein
MIKKRKRRAERERSMFLNGGVTVKPRRSAKLDSTTQSRGFGIQGTTQVPTPKLAQLPVTADTTIPISGAPQISASAQSSTGLEVAQVSASSPTPQVGPSPLVPKLPPAKTPTVVEPQEQELEQEQKQVQAQIQEQEQVQAQVPAQVQDQNQNQTPPTEVEKPQATIPDIEPGMDSSDAKTPPGSIQKTT